jgi:predicted phage-related endonuclease
MTCELDDVKDSVDIMRACNERIAGLKALAEQHRAVIEERMGSEEIGTVDGKPVVTWKIYKQNRLNQAFLKLSHPDIAESCRETTITRRMEIL